MARTEIQILRRLGARRDSFLGVRLHWLMAALCAGNGLLVSACGGDAAPGEADFETGEGAAGEGATSRAPLEPSEPLLITLRRGERFYEVEVQAPEFAPTVELQPTLRVGNRLFRTHRYVRRENELSIVFLLSKDEFSSLKNSSEVTVDFGPEYSRKGAGHVRKSLLMENSSQAAAQSMALSVTPAAVEAVSLPQGPYQVLTALYDHGDLAFTCETGEACSEIRGEVYYPSDLRAGPFPLVLMLHGQHETCYVKNPSTGQTDGGLYAWPCPPGYDYLPNHRGYDYLGRYLASYGYIVASVGANGINANGLAYDRTSLLEQHLEIWDRFNRIGSPTDGGPFAQALVGRVDMARIGTMGHSRGGRGVIEHASRWPATSRFRVSAVLPIAPTVTSVSKVRDAHLGLLQGYCDGDVSLASLIAYDLSRYANNDDDTSKYSWLVLGANHNYFNTVWTPDCWSRDSSHRCWEDDRGELPTTITRDDAQSSALRQFCDTTLTTNGRLSSAQQRLVAQLYVGAFFRHHLGYEASQGALLRGDQPPPSTLDQRVFAAYHPPVSQRVDLNRLNAASELTGTTLMGRWNQRGSVSQQGLADFGKVCHYLGIPTIPNCRYGSAHGMVGDVRTSDPAMHYLGLPRLRSAWSDPSATLANELPAGARDVSAYEFLQFRAGVDPKESRNPQGAPAEFSVTLRDSVTSATASTNQQVGNNVLFFPPNQPGAVSPNAVMNTVRLPLSLFSTVNLGDIRSVTFEFDRQPAGSVFLSDIAFSGSKKLPLQVLGSDT